MDHRFSRDVCYRGVGRTGPAGTAITHLVERSGPSSWFGLTWHHHRRPCSGLRIPSTWFWFVDTLSFRPTASPYTVPRAVARRSVVRSMGAVGRSERWGQIYYSGRPDSFFYVYGLGSPTSLDSWNRVSHFSLDGGNSAIGSWGRPGNHDGLAFSRSSSPVGYRFMALMSAWYDVVVARTREIDRVYRPSPG